MGYNSQNKWCAQPHMTIALLQTMVSNTHCSSYSILWDLFLQWAANAPILQRKSVVQGPRTPDVSRHLVQTDVDGQVLVYIDFPLLQVMGGDTHVYR